MHELHTIILAGGKSSRMKRRKELLLLQDVPLLQRLIERFGPLSASLSVVTSKERKYPFLPKHVRQIEDHVPDQGPVTGIHTGMKETQAPWYLILACDYPLLRVETIQLLWNRIKNTAWDGCVPIVNGQLHPLCAIYHQRTIPYWERSLKERRLKVLLTLQELHIDYVDLTSNAHEFLNMNTPSDYEKVREAVKGNE